MANTLLVFMQDVCDQLGISRPSSVVGSTDNQVRQLLSLLQTDVAEEITSRYVWPQLIRQHDITLSSGADGYALPGDFERQLFETHWNQDETWSMVGPTSQSEWQLRKYGIVATATRQRWRVFGRDDAQFHISPTPGAGDDGNTVSFEYVSRTWIRPKTWAASTAFVANSYCWYNGNIYQTTGGGTTGATAPTHTTGSGSDGGVTWIYIDDPYVRAQADTDTFILPEYLLRLCLKYLWKQAKGFPFTVEKKRYEDELDRQSTKYRGARTLNMASGVSRENKVGVNIPDTGYGL